MAIDFPASPALNQLFAADDKLWQWDGVAWTAYLAANAASIHGQSHGSTGIDPVTLAQSQVTGLTTDLAAKAPLASPIFSGNVGIGTSNPATKINISGSSPTLRIEDTGAKRTALDIYVTNSETRFQQTAYTDASSTPMTFYTSNSERLRIDGIGNVGIGTSSPADKLDVAGTIRVVGAAPAGSRTLLFNNSSVSVDYGALLGHLNASGYDAQIALGGTGGNANRISLITGDGAGNITERMRIDGAGLITGTGTSLGAWTAWTPTLSGTGWALGNGTIFGVYCQIGKVVHMRVAIVFGSTSTFGAGWSTISLPVTAATGIPTTHPCQLIDTSAGVSHFGMLRPDTTTALAIAYQGTNAQMIAVTSTAPFTWASTDAIRAWASYEAA